MGVGAGVGAVAPAEPVEWVRWKMARLGLAWLDLRLAALPDTLFNFLLVSNQPQPGSQPSQPEQRPCTPLGMPPILRAATSCKPVAVQTDSGLLPIRRAVGGAKYLPTAS